MATEPENAWAEGSDTRLAKDHPAAAGHFPGNPIMPGALLLDMVLLAIAGSAAAPSCIVKMVKFMRPIRPGDRLRIEWQRQSDGMHFRCVLPETGDIAITGIIRLGGEPI
jgi:3-hydroxymyristoyl/3-hydroxydecanoyl-(acyl carrier protein) dehydratase